MTMASVFLQLVNMGITAGWIACGVLLVRLLLRKAPKWISCLLWGLVGLRLVLPIAPVSKLSVMPDPQPIPVDIAEAEIPQVQTGIPAVNHAANPVLEKTDNLSGIIEILAIVWLIGVAVMLLYGLISYLLIRRKVGVSVPVERGVSVCDYVDTPFVLGFLRPRVYLPSDLDESCKTAVLAHERAHLRRHDHWWKPLGYGLLSVYWFHPLLWVAYILLCRDIEAACDEKVIKEMDLGERKAYSMALAECSVHRIRILTCPVAFGEVGVKARIRAVLSYKKPAFWIIIAAILLCGVAAVCLLTAPKPCDHNYAAQVTVAATCRAEGVRTYTCSLCENRYTEPIPMLSHAYGDAQIDTPATCTATGTAIRTCKDCGNRCTDTLAVLPHSYGEGVVVTPADCVQPGLANYTCTVCNHTDQLPMGTNDQHQYVSKVIKASTCVEAGEQTETCTLCGDTKVSALPFAKHNYKLEFTAEPTCLRVGLQRFGCTVCDKEYTTTLPRSSEHTWGRDRFCVYCVHCSFIKEYLIDMEEYHNSLPRIGISGYSYTNPVSADPSYPVIRWDVSPQTGQTTVPWPGTQ